MSAGHSLLKHGSFTVGWSWLPPLIYGDDDTWRAWLYTSAHDSDSLWWRILGLEICIRIQGRHY